MENKILKDAAGVVVEDPVQLQVDINPVNRIHAFLQRRSILPKKRTLIVKPITYGNLIRISSMLLEIDLGNYDVTNHFASNYDLLKQYGKHLAEIVAIAVHNKKSKPSPSLVRFILNNFTSKELLATVQIVLQQMNLTDFLNSIISIRGMNVLATKNVNAKNAENEEVSPKTQGSRIAPGTPSEVL